MIKRSQIGRWNSKTQQLVPLLEFIMGSLIYIPVYIYHGTYIHINTRVTHKYKWIDLGLKFLFICFFFSAKQTSVCGGGEGSREEEDDDERRVGLWCAPPPSSSSESSSELSEYHKCSSQRWRLHCRSNSASKCLRSSARSCRTFYYFFFCSFFFLRM